MTAKREHALAREFAKTHDPEIPEEIFELAKAAKRDGALTRFGSRIESPIWFMA